MKLTTIKPQTNQRNQKATIHRSGKLGFSSQAQENLNLDEKKYLKFAKDEEEETIRNLYVLILDKEDDETISVRKAGNYYYANTKSLFLELGLDYTSQVIIFDIVKIEIEGETYYKFSRRDKKRKNSN